jgi:hypothetical protein
LLLPPTAPGDPCRQPTCRPESDGVVEGVPRVAPALHRTQQRALLCPHPAPGSRLGRENLPQGHVRRERLRLCSPKLMLGRAAAQVRATGTT